MSARFGWIVSLAIVLAVAAVTVGRLTDAQDKSGAAAPKQRPAEKSADKSAATDEMKAIAAAREEVVKHFNAGHAEQLARLFLPQGELLDDSGTSHQGTEAIQALLTKYFEKYPGAKMEISDEAVCITGPVAIEEGTRRITTKEAGEAETQFITVWARTNDGWRIASTREVAIETLPTPHDQLQALAWLVGEWVNEGSDAVVSIRYRWSEDRNYLLGDFLVKSAGEVTMKSEQRIAWDPQTEGYRSWMFDSDGGFSESTWTEADEGWEIQSRAVLPDGSDGFATIHFQFLGNNRFQLRGTDRMIGGEQLDDFEVTVTRKAPAPADENEDKSEQ